MTIEESFKTIKNTHRSAVLFSLLISVLFLSARPALDPSLLNKEIYFLRNLFNTTSSEIIHNEIIDNTEEKIMIIMNNYQNEFDSKLKKLLDNWSGRTKLKFDIAINKPNPWKTDLQTTIIFLNSFYNQYHDIDSILNYWRALFEQGDFQPGKDFEEFKSKLTNNTEITVYGYVDFNCRNASINKIHTDLEISICDSSIPNDNEHRQYRTKIVSNGKEWDLSDIIVTPSSWSIKDRYAIIENQLNFSEKVGLETGLIDKNNRYISQFLALFSFKEDSMRDNLTLKDAAKEAARRGDKSIQSEILFPFGIKLTANEALSLFPIVHISLIIFGTIHLISFKKIIPFISSEVESFYPVAILTKEKYVYSITSIVTILSSILPLCAILINQAINLPKNMISIIAFVLYSISFIIAFNYCRVLQNTRKLLHEKQYDLTK
jgi:hypothetical protein